MRAVAALTALSCLLLVGCGGSRPETSTEPAPGATLEELWRAPGDDVAVIPGTENHEPGDVRVSFLVVDAEGAVVALPTARVWVADAPRLAAVSRDRGEARAHRRSRRRRGRRDAHLRREPPAAARREVLVPRGARGRRREGPGARERRRREERPASRRRRPGGRVRDADARLDRAATRRLSRRAHRRTRRSFVTRSPTRSRRRCRSS